jgi:hypothetical protein
MENFIIFTFHLGIIKRIAATKSIRIKLAGRVAHTIQRSIKYRPMSV